jgi:nucleotide-binding universal stress UspA family protein
LGRFDYEVSLFHAIRSNGQGQPQYQHIFSSKEYTRAAVKEMASTLKAAQTKLIDMGLKADKVSTQIDEKAVSRAGTIVDRAKQEDFGTIVMGRRGHSHVRDFFIGRVTNKVIHCMSLSTNTSAIFQTPKRQWLPATLRKKFSTILKTSTLIWSSWAPMAVRAWIK